MSEKVYQGSRNGTYITVSKIKMRVNAEDDGSTVSCRAEHPAIVQGEVYHHLQASANITVLCKFNWTFIFAILRFQRLVVVVTCYLLQSFLNILLKMSSRYAHKFASSYIAVNDAKSIPT